MKYCNSTGMVRWTGGQLSLRKGMTADDDHPFVLERPDLWTSTPPDPDLQTPGRAALRQQPPVERVTRAPGERRGRG